MRLVVLGGGAQGRVVASDLAEALPGAAVEVADVHAPELPARANLRWREADLSDSAAAVHLLAEYDLAVGVLPSRLGFGVMRAAIEARRPLVDVSFCPEDALVLDADARAAGIAILPDCGLAPGISNLVVGRAVAERGAPEEIAILVGGVAEDAARPFGYVVTWSLEDLLEEYTRPARIARGGRPVTVPVFSGLERVLVDGAGEMEAFYSDGLRSLLDTLSDVSDMGEKTLRWPGHVEAVQPLVRSGELIEEFRRRCVVEEPRDLVAFLVRMRWPNGATREVTMVDRYDPARRLTAMSRTTAFTCSAVAQLAASGGVRERGVLPLELVARDLEASNYVTDRLAERGVRLRYSPP